MRVIFIGTADFAVPSLKTIAAEHEIVTVVTQPDRPRGRGQKIQFTPVKEAALELGLEVYQPQRIRDPEAVQHLQNLSPQVIVLVAYGQILPESILEIPPLGCINVHASLLPAYRGAAPINWAIINGEQETGVTTMYMTPQLDSGDIILQSKIRIEPQDTAGTLHDKLAQEGALLIKKTLELLEQGKAPRLPQQEERATYAPPLTKEHERIDWSKSSQQVANLVRGMNPWPGAYTIYQGKILKILETVPLEHDQGLAPGTVLSIDKYEGFTVQCGTGSVLVTAVKPQGRKAMTGADFIRGYGLKPGMVLGSDV